MAAWHGGRWICGRELELEMQAVPSHKIIRNFKLMLYAQHEDSPQTRKVKEQLRAARKNEHQLLTEFLRYLWGDIRLYVDNELLVDDDDRDQYEELVYISVPALATPDATKKLRAAAVEAGLPRVEFLSEPLCAGACVLEEQLRGPGRLTSVCPSGQPFTYGVCLLFAT